MDHGVSTSKDNSDSGSGGESPSKDKLFDPSIDMLINDFDDERTLDEEEALAADENDEDDAELINLEKEGSLDGWPPYIPISSSDEEEEPFPQGEEDNIMVQEEEENSDVDVEEYHQVAPDEEDDDEDLPYLERPAGPLRYCVEGNMPLTELLALYHRDDGDLPESTTEEEDDEDDDMSSHEEEQICEPIVEKEGPPTPLRRSKLSILYEPLVDEADDTGNLGSVSRLDDDEEYGSGAEDDDPKNHKTIMIGGDYQAQIPEGLTDYNDSSICEDDQLLWAPQELVDKEVEEYLRNAQKVQKPLIPNGSALKDDEEALYTLHQCGYETEEALKRLAARPSPPRNNEARNINNLIWSEEECRSFEAGLRTYGKDFNLIQQNKVTTRSVGELVQFYYLWKKTERHDVFANKIRLDKQKYAVHPGFTDFMDRFLEDQERDHIAVSPGVSGVHGKPPDT